MNPVAQAGLGDLSGRVLVHLHGRKFMNGKRIGGSPPAPADRRVRLDTIPRCRRELARLYTEARAGRLPAQEATRLASIVTSIARLIEGAELEQRLDALEAAMGSEPPIRRVA